MGSDLKDWVKVMTTSTMEISLPASSAEKSELVSRSTQITFNVFKVASVALAAVAMVDVFGLGLVLILCLAVVLGDLSVVVAKENYSLDRRYEITLLILNTVSWIVPTVGLFIAGATFSVACIGVNEIKRANFYKFVSLVAVVNSVLFLSLLKQVV